MADDRRIREIILKIVDKIVNEYQPRKIILFGSYAYGEPSGDSDLDILVVTEKRLTHYESYKMQEQFLRDFSIPVQLVCVSREEFEETKDIIGGITYPASKYGEVLYEKS